MVIKHTSCPWCETLHDRASGIDTPASPKDGDFTLCIRCGELCVFDRGAAGGLRKPTRREQREIERNETLFEVRKAWFAARALHR